MAGVIWIVALVLVLFTVSYVGYGRYLSQFVGLDDSRETPAHKYQDGQEYVPAKKPVLLGHHYSSIAGGAPIVGPITAALVWGWVPAALWVAIGNPLIGAVHDFVSLSGSLRHEGKSIGYIIGEYVGEQGKNMLLWFAFLLTILVVAVFALVIGFVFDSYPQAATASMLYVALALFFGFWLYQLNLPFSVGTVVFVTGIFATVYVGIQYPIAFFGAEFENAPDTIVLFGETAPSIIPELGFNPNVGMWVLVMLVYGAIASVLPVWMLLQPRDYLSSFLLYTGVGGALLAVIVGTFVTSTSEPLTFQVDAWYGAFGSENAGYELMPLFPLLFITIACGTVSGFHSLVSSGTTAKQLDKETDARLIGYGGMLGEGLLAAVALCTIGIAGFAGASGGIGLALPNFADGGGVILTAFGIPESYGAPFMALVLASFLLTSMDTAVRLSRYMVEELVGTPTTSIQSFAANRYANTSVVVLVAFLLLGTGSWEDLWLLFGGANQLLAALALLTGTVWLTNWDRSKQLISTGGPLAVMGVITVLGLLWVAFYQVLFVRLISGDPGIWIWIAAGSQIVINLTLVGLALALFWKGYGNIKSTGDVGGEPVAADGGDGIPEDD
ncbi:carbon starvation protein A [Natrialba sp. PRR66]|uniref:carbon starvation CstA family protein n=1 Tax=Natrialba sp. PRR66 TaxID=3098146 RepID=UPI002B1D0380|nr:carbon starvation protein A [Natrialba sp. PRR66]